jgi:hypothetical protein
MKWHKGKKVHIRDERPFETRANERDGYQRGTAGMGL